MYTCERVWGVGCGRVRVESRVDKRRGRRKGETGGLLLCSGCTRLTFEAIIIRIKESIYLFALRPCYISSIYWALQMPTWIRYSDFRCFYKFSKALMWIFTSTYSLFFKTWMIISDNSFQHLKFCFFLEFVSRNGLQNLYFVDIN